jgi:hypothetical protein
MRAGHVSRMCATVETVFVMIDQCVADPVTIEDMKNAPQQKNS